MGMVFCLHVCAYGPRKAEEGVRPLKLELEVSVSHHMGAGNQTRVLWKKQLGHLTTEHLSSPYRNFQ